MSEHGSQLVARSVEFFSDLDEEQFFGWLDKCVCVVGYHGDGTDFIIEVNCDELHDTSLRELLALFYRYGVDLAQLSQFESETNRAWFRDSRAYWHSGVFGN